MVQSTIMVQTTAGYNEQAVNNLGIKKHIDSLAVIIWLYYNIKFTSVNKSSISGLLRRYGLGENVLVH